MCRTLYKTYCLLFRVKWLRVMNAKLWGLECFSCHTMPKNRFIQIQIDRMIWIAERVSLSQCIYYYYDEVDCRLETCLAVMQTLKSKTEHDLEIMYHHTIPVLGNFSLLFLVFKCVSFQLCSAFSICAKQVPFAHLLSFFFMAEQLKVHLANVYTLSRVIYLID